MPIVLLTGLPASGKSTRARQLQDYFVGRGKVVHLISENEAVPKALYEKNACFMNADNEKIIRGDLRSEVVRHLNKEDVVIFDAGNYIKGFRYELHCNIKASRTTQLTLFTCIPKEQAWTFNEQRKDPDTLQQADGQQLLTNSNVPYSRETFDLLCQRYEEPQSSSRWDSPLVVALPEDDINLDDIYKALYERQALPPNQSTQNPPLAPDGFLNMVDFTLQELIKEILGAIKIKAYGQLRVQGSTVKVKVATSMNAIQLNRLRKQFINSMFRASQTTPPTVEQVPQLFVQYINANTVGC